MNKENDIESLLKSIDNTYKCILNEMKETDRVSIMPYLTTSMEDIMVDICNDGQEIRFTVKIMNEGNAPAVDPQVKLLKTETGGIAIAAATGERPRYGLATPMDTSVLTTGKKNVFQSKVDVSKIQHNDDFTFNVQFSDLRGQKYCQQFRIIYSYDKNKIQLARRVVHVPVKEGQNV